MVSTDVNAPERKRSSLTVSSGLLGLSTILARLTTLVVMALLARGAGAEAVGYYGLATLAASFTAAALSIGLPTYLTRDVAAGLVSPPEVGRIHCGRLVVLLLAAGAAYPVSLLAVPAPIRVGFFLFFLASVLEQWNETAWVLVRGTHRAWVEPLTNTSVGLALVAVCAADAWLGDGLAFGDAAAYVVVAAIVRSGAAFVVVGIWRAVRTPGRLDLVRHARRSLPYFATDLLGLVYFRGDVAVLALFVTATQVGEYVAAAAIIGPAVQVAASMGIGALAYAAPRIGAGRPSTDDPLTIFTFFRTAGQAAAGLIGIGLPIAVAILFGGEGRTTLALASILTLFLALRFANFGLSAILLAHGKASSRLVVLVLSICASVGLNLLLDRRFEAYGAASAAALTELVVAGSLLWFVRIGALVRPVLAAVGCAAGAAILLSGLSAVASPTAVAVITGVYFVAIAALSFLYQRRASRRTQHTIGESV
jgi:O-antigen/teichoic acid export membrane protein